MKNVFIAAAFTMISLFVNNANANTKSERLSYDKKFNPAIEVQVSNLAKKATFIIKSEDNKIIKKGAVKGDQKIAIPTKDLDKGVYKFEIGGAIQEFEIK